MAAAADLVAATVVEADTGKHSVRGKRLAKFASRFLLCISCSYFEAAFRKVTTLGVPQPVTLSQPLVTVSEVSKPKLMA